MPGYQIAISMNQATVQALLGNSYSLCGWKVVKTTAGGAQPAVWFVTNDYMINTLVAWEPQYKAYATNPGGVSVAAPIGIGEIMEVNTTTTVVSGGPSDAMSILNQTTTPYTCGLSAQIGGNDGGAIVAAPLFGNALNAFAPVESVLLMFTSYPLEPGSIVTRSYAQGILIDAASRPSSSVSFDINHGWAWDGDSWAQVILADVTLAMVLIQPSPLATGS